MIILSKVKWFTIIELVVVITILSILGTIGFISFIEFTTSSRDANRKQQLSRISNWLEVYKRNNKLPLPDNMVSISSSWEILSYQWYAWVSVLEKILYNKWWKDPKDEVFYTYYVDKKRKNYQLLAFLEEKNKYSNHFITQTFAKKIKDYNDRYIYLIWKKLWVIVESWSSLPIQFNNTLVSNWLDLYSTTWSYIVLFTSNNSISWTWNILIWLSKYLSNFSEWWLDIKKTCKEIINSDKKSINNDWYYLINPTWNKIFSTYCDMTTEWWWWTRISYSEWGTYKDAVLDMDLTLLTEMYYRYIRLNNTNQEYAFKFKKLRTKQCDLEFWSTWSISIWTQDYIWHVLNLKSWWKCDRIGTTWDSNYIEIQKILNNTFADDTCINWNFIKSDARNYAWWTWYYNWRVMWWAQHRISNNTVLFWPLWNSSSRCAWVSTWAMSANKISLFAR